MIDQLNFKMLVKVKDDIDFLVTNIFERTIVLVIKIKNKLDLFLSKTWWKEGL